ncbi:hypothetical protein Btru_039573, partial [Bulinus truncatus]
LRIEHLAFTEKMNVTIKMKRVVFDNKSYALGETNISCNAVASRGDTWSTYTIIMTDSLYNNRKTVLCSMDISADCKYITCHHNNTRGGMVSDRNVTITVNETHRDSTRSSIIFEEKFNLMECTASCSDEYDRTQPEFQCGYNSVLPVQVDADVRSLDEAEGQTFTLQDNVDKNRRVENFTGNCKVQFNKTVFSGNDVALHMDQIVGVQFRNLTPFTNYMVSVVSAGGGGESDGRQLIFTTNKTGAVVNFALTCTETPLRPPDIDGFSYQRVDHVISPSNNSMVIYIFWRPLPVYSRGGENVQYKTGLNSTNGFNVSFVSSETFGFFTVPFESLEVRIWSVNEVGQSSNSSGICIAENKGVMIPKAYVEFDQDNYANVYTHITVHNGLSQLAILWCRKTQFIQLNTSLDVCQEYPNTELFPLNLTAHSDDDILLFKVFLNPKKIAKVSIYSQPLQYFDFEFTNHTLNDFHIVMANVTEVVQFGNRQLTSEMDIVTGDDEGDDDTLSLGSGDVRNPQFFVSINKNDHWRGVSPADCYFDSSKNIVNLEMVQFTDESGNYFLRFIQKCDTSIANQFLVKFYEVYSSDDGTCLTKGHKVCEVNNTFFQPSVCPLKDDVQFVCVLARAGDKSSMESKALVYPTGETKLEMKTVIIVSCLTVGVFLLLGVICFVVTCRRRRAHFARVLGSAEEFTSASYASSSYTVSEDVGCSLEINLNEINNPKRQVSGDGEHYNMAD